VPPKVIVVTGPTATGKTRLGAALAKRFSGEVVSSDSMQIYKYMDIGTAKPVPEEMCGIPHHMIDVVTPFEKYSAGSGESLVFEHIIREERNSIDKGAGLCHREKRVPKCFFRKKCVV